MQYKERNNLLLANFVDCLRRWITDGTSQGSNGAFHAWYDARKGELAYEYPEITGYALTYLSNYSEGTAAGRRAADWLVNRIALNNLTAREKDNIAVYNFDLAMIATGLMSFGQAIHDDRYSAVGLHLVDFIREQILAGGHLLPLNPAYPASPRKSTWSTDGSAHLLKVVQCLLIAQELGAAGMQEAITCLVRSASELQTSSGRFITHPTDIETFLHPHLYAAEGLWMWGMAQGNCDALEQARRAVTWAWSHQLDTGGFPNKVNNVHGYISDVEQSDVTAQAVRLALLLSMSFEGLDRAIERLLQVSHGDESRKALLYQPTTANLHENTWATLFGAQALEVALVGRQALSWRLFV
jgi:hypothetical protein